MARRTLRFTAIKAHKKGKPNEPRILNNLKHPNGTEYDFLHIFWGFIGMVTEDDLKNDNSRHSTLILDESKAQGRIVEFATDTGAFGEEGKGVNTRSWVEDFKYDEDHAILVTTHGVLVSPEGSSYAILFNESSATRSGAKKVLDLFLTQMREAFPDISFKSSTITENDAWLREAELLSVSMEVVTPSKNEEDFDRPKVKDRKVTVNIAPPDSGSHLDKGLLATLRTTQELPVNSLALIDDSERGETFVTVGKDGRRRTFRIGEEKTPPAALQICDHGDPAPTQSMIRNICLNEAPGLFSRLGVEWNEQQSHQEWSDDALAVTVVKPPSANPGQGSGQ